MQWNAYFMAEHGHKSLFQLHISLGFLFGTELSLIILAQTSGCPKYSSGKYRIKAIAR